VIFELEVVMVDLSIWIWLVGVMILSPVVLGLLLMGLQKKVRLIHSTAGISKNGYVGYSWSYLIFGWFVPVYRGEIGIGVLHLLIALISVGLSQLIFPFVYNRQFMNRMLTSGWQLDTTDQNYEIARQKLNIVL
jgi:hypothetical protein